MDITHALLGASLILGFGMAWIALVAYLRYRRARVVACPVDGEPAAIRVDARHAALTALPRSVLRVETCSRWPDRRDCLQFCLDQVEAGLGIAPAGTVLARWYAARRCALCSARMIDVRWADRPPALMDANGRLMNWYELPQERLAVLVDDGEYRPVCWECHLARTLWLDVPPAQAPAGTAMADVSGEGASEAR